MTPTSRDREMAREILSHAEYACGGGDPRGIWMENRSDIESAIASALAQRAGEVREQAAVVAEKHPLVARGQDGAMFAMPAEPKEVASAIRRMPL